MNSRKLWINIHLVFAAIFMPLMLMMPITGSLYLLGYQGDQTKTEVFRIHETAPNDEMEREEFFRKHLAAQGIDPTFEYIRSTKTEFIMRPTTRVYYVANIESDKTLIISRVEPTMLKRLIELHKGHGPRAMRWFEAAFGLALIITTLSGLWLAWTVKPYRMITLSAFGAGLLIMLVCLF
ncbi:MAG: PepSY domain-containing protein [Bdellovibrionaceae bacterium]|nr:PepSY domain-containing protein [Pseudobdellovibrionaceae bacterium]